MKTISIKRQQAILDMLMKNNWWKILNKKRIAIYNELINNITTIYV